MAEGDVRENSKLNPPVDPQDQTSAILSQYFAGRLAGGVREVYERGKMMEDFSNDPAATLHYGKYPAGYADQLLRHIGYRHNNGVFEPIPDVEGSPMAKLRLKGDVAQLLG